MACQQRIGQYIFFKLWPLTLLFCCYFLRLCIYRNIIILLLLLLFRCKLAAKEPQTYISNMVFVLNSGHECDAVTCQSHPNEPGLALMPHPTQCEMKGSGSEWMGMLERFMGTRSARAVGGLPLTMLWLLLWTINRCLFLFCSFPQSFSLPKLSSSEARFALHDDHSPPIWIWQTYHETWKEAIMVSWLSRLIQTRTGSHKLGSGQWIQKQNPCRITVNMRSHMTAYSRNQSLFCIFFFCSNLTILDHWLLNSQQSD